DLTRDEIKDAPDREADPALSENQSLTPDDPQAATLGGAVLGGLAGQAYLVGDTRLEPRADEPPHMDREAFVRSSKELIGYDVYARDQELGEVEDVIVSPQEASWDVEYLVVGGMAGRRTLVPVSGISDAGWP